MGTRAPKTIFFLLVIWVLSWYQARSQSNPFDLSPRRDTLVVAKTKELAGTVDPTVDNNYFDLAPSPVPKREESKHVPRLQEKATPLQKGDSVLSSYRRFLFIVVMSVLIIFTFLVTLFRFPLGKIYRAFTNEKLLNQLHREWELGWTFPILAFYLMFFINGGFFLFLLSRYYGLDFVGSNMKSLLFCTGALFGLILFKHLLLNLTGYIFPVKRETSLYNFTIMIFGTTLGVILLPANILIAYAPPEMVKYIIYALYILIISIYLLRSLRGLLIAGKFLAFHKFHFLLYICTVEIAPALILIKLFLIRE